MLFFAPNKKIIACTLTFENCSFCKGANTVSKIVCVCILEHKSRPDWQVVERTPKLGPLPKGHGRAFTCSSPSLKSRLSWYQTRAIATKRAPFGQVYILLTEFSGHNLSQQYNARKIKVLQMRDLLTILNKTQHHLSCLFKSLVASLFIVKYLS